MSHSLIPRPGNIKSRRAAVGPLRIRNESNVTSGTVVGFGGFVSKIIFTGFSNHSGIHNRLDKAGVRDPDHRV